MEKQSREQGIRKPPELENAWAAASLHHCPRTAALHVSVGIGALEGALSSTGCPLAARVGTYPPTKAGFTPWLVESPTRPRAWRLSHKLGALFPSGEIGWGRPTGMTFIFSLRPGASARHATHKDWRLGVSGPACVPCPSPGLPALLSPENWLQCPSLPRWGFMFPII